MPIEIREYLGSNINISESSSKRFMNITEGYNTIDPISKSSIMQEIEGIHVGPTRNYTWYMDEALDSSIQSWTKPYQRPLIMHHNETDGKIIGRVVQADKITKNTRSGTNALVFTCNVPDKEGKEQILDGRLKTVSIGVIAHDIRCSICGEQVQLDSNGYPECGHNRGEQHDGQTCYWKIYSMEAKELSYVIVPSDIYTHNLRTYNPEKKDITVTESLNNKGLKPNEGVLKDMPNPKIEPKEGQVIDENVKDTIIKEEEPKVTEPETKVAKPDTKVDESDIKTDAKDAELVQLKADLAKAEADKVTLTTSLNEVKASLADATKKVEDATKDLKTEVALKESAEGELITLRTKLRESTEETFNSLRLVLNKPIATKESLSTRTFESIKDSIADLKEEMSGLENIKHISKAQDPSIQVKENSKKLQENKKLNVKESNSYSNINLEDGMKNILSSFMN